MYISKTPCGDTPPPHLARYPIYARQTHLLSRSVFAECLLLNDLGTLFPRCDSGAGGRGLGLSERKRE